MAGPVFGGQGVTGSLRGQASNAFELQAGQAALVPSGTWNYRGGPYCALQEYDIITGIWRAIGDDGISQRFIRSDGNNFRTVNQSGCVIGAQLTAKGSGYTSAPTVVDVTTGAVYQAILGPVVNTAVTVTNGGSGYTYPPQVVISAPPAPGIQATAYCTLTNGVVTSVTITDQGGGYTGNPTITFINDPREGQNGVALGSGAAATATTTGAGTVAGVVVLDHGNPVTALPTITISGGGGSGATATPIMCWALTGYAVTGTASGTGYSGVVEVTALGNGYPSGTGYTNPSIQSNLLRGRRASILAALSGANITTAGQTVETGGLYAGIPNSTALILASTPPTTAATLTFTVGGANDSYRLFAA